MLAVVDAGPLYAAADADDNDHLECLAILERSDLVLVIPALVITEVAYLIGTRLGPGAEAAFLGSLAQFEVEAPSADDWTNIALMVDRYGDFPLGGVDASVAVLADRLGTDLVITLDHRHFAAIRSTSGGTYHLLPG